MAKLLPPIIEGTIPAFYSENGMVKITIPFSINRAVSNAQIKGLALKAKTVQSSSYLFTNTTINSIQFSLEGAPWVEFQITEQELINKIKIGQFYKFQIAFIDNSNEIGYYSTVATGKCTTKPIVNISNLSSGGVNIHYYRYEGRYSQKNGDTTEKVYSYQFNIYDEQENIVASSGELLHNSSQDTELYESYDVFNLTTDLEEGKNYFVQYTVTTVNNLTVSTPKYRIVQRYSVDPLILARVIPELNYEDGYIKVSLASGVNSIGEKETASGTFILSRSSEDTNYKLWDELYRFRLIEEFPDIELWKDFTVEQGKHYKYSIQQYSDKGMLSNRIISNAVYVDFEYAFLFDGERQLKIKFNPKISSFKVDVLETKTDTIGSQYPFIFRNGRVNYKEFPISGLISCQMDDEELFINKEDLYFEEDQLTKKGRTGTSDHTVEFGMLVEKEKLTNLNSENIKVERLFKLKVLEWLTNGEIKLFRSPTEGNYLVRLMNASLTPNDTLGRMLHTFTCTAYEVMEFNYENLKSLKILEVEKLSTSYKLWETILFAEQTYNELGELVIKYKTPGVMNNFTVNSVEFFDMRPGSLITLIYENGNSVDIRIGLSGRYSVDEGMPIRNIKIHGPTTGGMTYSYYTTMKNAFDKITNIYLEDVPARQFIGEHNIIQEIEYVYDEDNDIMVKNPKVDISTFYYIYAKPRGTENIVTVTRNNRQYYFRYRNDQYDNAFLSVTDPTKLYTVGSWENNKFIKEYYYDFSNNEKVELDERKHELNINNEITFINDTSVAVVTGLNPALGGTIDYYPMKFLEMENVGRIETLKATNGLITEIGYQIRIVDYSIEDDFRYNTFYKKAEYDKAILKLEEYLAGPEEYSEEREQLYRQTIDKKYAEYILALVKDLADESEIDS